MSRAWSVRPSELLAVDDRWVAWQVDSAVHAAGTVIDAELDRAEVAEMRRKRPDVERAVTRALDRILGLEARRERDRPQTRTTFDQDAWMSGGRLVAIDPPAEGAA